jgi:hypothetical protein
MKISTRKIKIAFVAFLLVACVLAFSAGHRVKGWLAPASADAASADGLVTEIQGYKNWTKVNELPELMPARVAALCGVPNSRVARLADRPGNPHRDKYFIVYVNDAGRAAMLEQKSPKFPEGSVIVKEKLPNAGSVTPELLTVMIKRKEGSNPAGGDWEYLVLDGSGARIEARGNLENCQSCHVANRKNDYIFRTYLPAAVQSGLK